MRLRYRIVACVAGALKGAAVVAILTGCQTRYINLPADPVIARDCSKPTIEGDLVRDLGKAYLERGKAIDECNDRLRALRGEVPRGTGQ